jgi:tubulin alpha
MTREIITIAVGGAGCRMALEFWRRLMAEHGIAANGRSGRRPSADAKPGIFFAETRAGQYAPRALFVDLDPATGDELRAHELRQVLHPDCIVIGKTDAASNFGRGRELGGEGLVDRAVDRVRKLVDDTANLQGFILFHAAGGGTGSGVAAALLHRLAADYRKKSVVSFTLMPSPVLQRAATEPYNAMFTLSALRTRSDLSFVFDNDALYGMCQRSLGVKDPSLADLNRLIGQAAADVTALLRFAEAESDLGTLQTSLVCAPGRHFVTLSIAPVAAAAKLGRRHPNVPTISKQVLSPSACLATCDPSANKTIAALLIYRGDAAAKEINASLTRLKAQGWPKMVEGVAGGLKAFLVDAVAASVAGDARAAANRSVTLLAATTAMASYLRERVDDSAGPMHAGQAYMHWFARAGVNGDDFAGARADLQGLIEAYASMLDS